MAKGFWFGADGKAKKGKKIWFGTDGKAKKVKAAWIGVGEKARLFYSAEPSYDGTATPLSVARYDLAAATVGNYSLFAGGMTGLNGAIAGSSVVDTYNASLTRGTASNLTGGYQFFNYLNPSISIGNYALFPAGAKYSGSNRTGSDVVDTYDTSLTKGTAPKLSVTMGQRSCGKVGNYALIAGGGTYLSVSNVIDVYDSSLTKQSSKTLSRNKAVGSSFSIGNYVVFAGGSVSSNVYSEVDAFDSSLTKVSSVTALTQAKSHIGGASNEMYGILVGGRSVKNAVDATILNMADVYNTSLTKTSISNITQRSHAKGANTSEYAFFMGGNLTTSNSEIAIDAVEAFDKSLTRTLFSISTPRVAGGSAVNGEKILFGGGVVNNDSHKATTIYDTVDIISI